MSEMNYSYDAKFEGNILIVGRTGCGKSTFAQNLGKNKILGKTRKPFGCRKYHFQRTGRMI